MASHGRASRPPPESEGPSHVYTGNRCPPSPSVPFEPADPRLLDRAIAIARAAGAVIMPFYRQGTAARFKTDASPVTAADEAADALIVDALRDLTPTTPVVSEESADQFRGKAPAGTFWLVDPLDGTKEFISERDEFTVNIALVEDGRPVLGVVFLPVRNEIYAGSARGGAIAADGSDQRRIHCRRPPAGGAIVAVSRSHGEKAADGALIAGCRIAGEVHAGSALKFCLVARGDADVYPRAGRTMEWDTAAGHAVLLAAGGNVFDRSGLPLTYGKPGFENPSFVARGIIAQL